MSNSKSCDNSFSEFSEEAIQHLSHQFTEVSLVKETESHQLYRAKRFGRWYLLKALSPALRNSKFHLQMLHKEMEVLMQLQHPGIVDCLGMEHLADYTDSEGKLISVGPCIILEYIDGETLAETIKNNSSFFTLHSSFLDELLDALAYMHAAGITHRDLKPSNIMVTHNGQHIKIIDFSLADTDSHAILKQPSGTRKYISPEQSTATTPDVRNDIFSFGVILDELLKGNPSIFNHQSSIFKKIAHRCQLPIEQRYANIAALQADIARRQRSRSRLHWAAVLLVPTLMFLAIIGSLLHTNYMQNRIPRATSHALAQLEDSIAATGLTQHIDTLSRWEYLDPKVNEKILSVNAFIYDYAENEFVDCSESERNDILCKMLDRWQVWHDSIVHQAKFLISKSEKANK